MEKIIEEQQKEVKKEEIEIEKVRKLPLWLEIVISIFASLIAIYEILYIFNFNFILYDLFSKLNIYIAPLKITFQITQGEAFILGLILFIAFILYPIRKKDKYFKKIPWYDFLLAIIGISSLLYLFFIYPRYAEFSILYLPDIIIGLIAIILVLEGTRRVLGWVLPVVVLFFILYGIYNIGFNLPRFVQQLSFDEGIFGTPFFVMTIYVFAFVLFGEFLLNIGISDYITLGMMAIFGKRPGGPAKAAVVASGLMGTVSGSSVANVLTVGTFTIPLMKRAGYPKEVAGAIEPAASTGGQLMPPVMGAAAFIMAEYLGIPYNKIIIAAIIPALLYYSSVYLFIDAETRRLGLMGTKERLMSLSYFLRKFYIFIPLFVIIITLVMGVPPQICAISSLGMAVWVGWISKDNIKGNEFLFVSIVLIYFILIFINGWISIIILSLLILLLISLAIIKKFVEFNEKFYITILFLIFTIFLIYINTDTRWILFLSGIFGLIFSLLVGIFSKSKDGKNMFSATYRSIINSGKTATPIMLAGASAGLIQGVLTMTGLITKIGYSLVDVTGGIVILILIMAMAFSLILGMGVPTTANYIITSLVIAPAIYYATINLPPYNYMVPGYSALIGLLAANFFVFYFGILADLTPPVALASYAGATIAQSDFWKTGLNAIKYAIGGFIAPYIFFYHPEMLLITVGHWNLFIALNVIFEFVASIIIIYIFTIGLIGFYKKKLNNVYRAVLVSIGVAGITLNIITVILAIAAIITLRILVKK
jgi:TRAP transporter 4TM/12TM fusion protein